MARIPKYRRRKDRPTAYVEMNGERIGLPGLVDSPESMAEYGRLISLYLAEHAKASKRAPSRPSAVGLTITDLIREWMAHCKVHYVGTANTISNEYDNCRYAVRPLNALFGGVAVEHFTTDELREVRAAMVSGNWSSKACKRSPKPWSRRHANSAVNRIKRLFRWAVEHNRCRAEVAGPIMLLSPLEAGRTAAKDRDPVCPVDPAYVDATAAVLPPIISAMVRLQRLTGLRPDNVCSLRPMDIDRASDVWIYRPPKHKGTAKEKLLAVAIGPKAQAVLTPFVDRPADAFCFDPREAPRRSRQPGNRYTSASYRRAIRYGIRKANKIRAQEAEEKGKTANKIPLWFPYQLRHTWATEVRKRRNLEAARVVLGHSRIATTEIYAERDLGLAVEIAREMG